MRSAIATGVAMGTAFGRRAGRAFGRELNRFARDLALGQTARFRCLFDCVPVAVAGGEIHPGVDTGRILPKFLLDATHGFDELAPVHRSEKTQTADAVRD